MIRSGLLRNSPDRAFESLYRRHVKDVYRYSLALLDRQPDAEDATQTTFMNAYRALERGERPRDAAKWLHAIALNVCREHFRRAGRRPDEVSLEDDPGDLVLDPPTPEIGDVVRGLSCLPFNQRAALVMREFEGRSVTEIAAELEVSSSAVEALLFRGRRALREQLEEKLTCSQAERAISRQLDGALPRAERGPLRAHLRECRDCAGLARRLRAQRSALRSLALLPVPASLRLTKLAGGGAAPVAAAATPAAVGTGGSLLSTLAGSVAAKIAVVALAGATAIGVGYDLTSPRRPAQTARAVAATADRTETHDTASTVRRALQRQARSTGSTSGRAVHAGSTREPAKRSQSRDERSTAVSSKHARGHRAAKHTHTSQVAALTTVATKTKPAHPASSHPVTSSGGQGQHKAYGTTNPKRTGPAATTAPGTGSGNPRSQTSIPPGQLKSHLNSGPSLDQ